jgi:hypothetical protein
VVQDNPVVTDNMLRGTELFTLFLHVWADFFMRWKLAVSDFNMLESLFSDCFIVVLLV